MSEMKIIAADKSYSRDSDDEAAIAKIKSDFKAKTGQFSSIILTNEILGALCKIASNDSSDFTMFHTLMVSILDYYAGENKTLSIIFGGYCEYIFGAYGGNVAIAGFQKGEIPGVGEDYAIFCVVSWS